MLWRHDYPGVVGNGMDQFIRDEVELGTRTALALGEPGNEQTWWNLHDASEEIERGEGRPLGRDEGTVGIQEFDLSTKEGRAAKREWDEQQAEFARQEQARLKAQRDAEAKLKQQREARKADSDDPGKGPFVG